MGIVVSHVCEDFLCQEYLRLVEVGEKGDVEP